MFRNEFKNALIAAKPDAIEWSGRFCWNTSYCNAGKSN